MKILGGKKNAKVQVLDGFERSECCGSDYEVLLQTSSGAFVEEMNDFDSLESVSDAGLFDTYEAGWPWLYAEANEVSSPTSTNSITKLCPSDISIESFEGLQNVQGPVLSTSTESFKVVREMDQCVQEVTSRPVVEVPRLSSSSSLIKKRSRNAKRAREKRPSVTPKAGPEQPTENAVRRKSKRTRSTNINATVAQNNMNIVKHSTVHSMSTSDYLDAVKVELSELKETIRTILRSFGSAIAKNRRAIVLVFTVCLPLFTSLVYLRKDGSDHRPSNEEAQRKSYEELLEENARLRHLLLQPREKRSADRGQDLAGSRAHQKQDQSELHAKELIQLSSELSKSIEKADESLQRIAKSRIMIKNLIDGVVEEKNTLNSLKLDLQRTKAKTKSFAFSLLLNMTELSRRINNIQLYLSSFMKLQLLLLSHENQRNSSDNKISSNGSRLLEFISEKVNKKQIRDSQKFDHTKLAPVKVKSQVPCSKTGKKEKDCIKVYDSNSKSYYIKCSNRNIDPPNFSKCAWTDAFENNGPHPDRRTESKEIKVQKGTSDFYSGRHKQGSNFDRHQGKESSQKKNGDDDRRKAPSSRHDTRAEGLKNLYKTFLTRLRSSLFRFAKKTRTSWRDFLGELHTLEPEADEGRGTNNIMSENSDVSSKHLRDKKSRKGIFPHIYKTLGTILSSLKIRPDQDNGENPSSHDYNGKKIPKTSDNKDDMLLKIFSTMLLGFDKRPSAQSTSKTFKDQSDEPSTEKEKTRYRKSTQGAFKKNPEENPTPTRKKESAHDKVFMNSNSANIPSSGTCSESVGGISGKVDWSRNRNEQQ